MYYIRAVPTTNEALIDTCLLILHDWSYYLNLDEKDIDDERGVITEEWRSRRNSGSRLREQQNPVLLKGSKYAERNVIGKLEVIQHFKPEIIREFYHKWYRTDLEAIAIAGDFDVAMMEEKIKKVFSSIPVIENPEPRPFYEVPSHEETYFVLATDKEATKSDISLIRFWLDEEPTGKATYQDIKDDLIESFYNTMISNRIREMVQKGTAPFISASIGVGGFVKGYMGYNVSASAKPNEEKEAFTSVLQENERILQHGFTESELERAKANMMTGLESALKDTAKTNNESYIEEMQNHFLEKSPIVTFLDYYNTVKEIMPTITAAEVSAKAKEWFGGDNRTIVITGPSEGVTHLTEEEARAILAEVTSQTVEAYVDQTVDGNLIKEELKGSPIVAVKALDEFDAEEWTLENGAKVIFRKADFEKDNVSLSAYSAGGTSLYDLDMLVSARNTSSLVGTYGLGDFDAIALNKVLTGKKANCSVSIGSLYEDVNGSAIPQDFETMMQMLYLRFEKPRFDSDAHQVMIDRSCVMMDQMKGNPEKMKRDSVQLILSNYNPRTILMDSEKLRQVTVDKVEQVYRDRIADASDFTFFIVGNIEAETVKPLVEKYIGSISSSHRNEQWIDRNVRGPQGEVEKVIEIPLETPKSTVVVYYSKEMPYDVKESFEIFVLGSILDIRYMENIREKEGGTYGVGVSGSAYREPVGEYTLTMQFDCEPDRAEHLKSLIYAELDKILRDGVTEEELSKVVLNINKNREQSKHHNSYWMNTLKNYYRTGVNSNDPANYEDIINGLTVEDIQNFTKKFLEDVNRLDIMFVPKK